jgi:hypothetical protein
MADCTKTFDLGKTNKETTTTKNLTQITKKFAHCHLLENDKKNIKTYDPKQNKINDYKETQHNTTQKITPFYVLQNGNKNS